MLNNLNTYKPIVVALRKHNPSRSSLKAGKWPSLKININSECTGAYFSRVKDGSSSISYEYGNFILIFYIFSLFLGEKFRFLKTGSGPEVLF